MTMAMAIYAVELVLTEHLTYQTEMKSEM